MSSRDELRAMLERAAARARPGAPDWQGAAHLARRAARLRLAVGGSAAVLATGALLAGGLAARAALDDEEPPASGTAPADTTPRDDDGDGDGDGTTTNGTTGTAPRRPDLTVSMARRDRFQAVAFVRSTTIAPEEPFSVSFEGTVKPRRREVEGGELSTTFQVELRCRGEVTARVDPEKRVEESNEDNNEARVDCGGEEPPEPETETGPGPVD